MAETLYTPSCANKTYLRAYVFYINTTVQHKRLKNESFLVTITYFLSEIMSKAP